jgi:fructokinase
VAETLSLGVDLGGTKIEAALLARRVVGASDDTGHEVPLRRRVPTRSELGYASVLETTANLVRSVASEAGLELARLPLGVGMPGSVTARDGLVKNSNTVCLNGRPFREDLMRALDRRIAFENDANCFALAEAQLGAGKPYRHGVVFGVIMGTGVGGGIVMNGKVWPGPQHLGGEWGHHAVGPWRRHGVSGAGPSAVASAALSERGVCYCGNTGCLELYLSGPALERDYARRSGHQKNLAEIAARRDLDVHAGAAIDEMLEAFGRGVANLIDILDPSAIVLGGGVSNLEFLLEEGRERVRRYVFNDELATPVVRNELGDSAGVLGAALLEA